MPHMPWLFPAVMERLASPLNVRSLVATGAIVFLSFVVTFAYRALNIRRRTAELRRMGLVL